MAYPFSSCFNTYYFLFFLLQPTLTSTLLPSACHNFLLSTISFKYFIAIIVPPQHFLSSIVPLRGTIFFFPSHLPPWYLLLSIVMPRKKSRAPWGRPSHSNQASPSTRPGPSNSTMYATQEETASYLLVSTNIEEDPPSDVEARASLGSIHSAISGSLTALVAQRVAVGDRRVGAE